MFASGWTVRIVPAGDSNSPRLVNTCLITNHVKRLVEFYEPVLALKAKKTGEEYVEFPTGVGVLAIFSRTLKKSTFLVRQRRRRTGAWCCNSASVMWIKNTSDYRAL